MPKYMTNRGKIYDRIDNHNLRVDLVEHIFSTYLNHVVDNWYNDLFEDTNEDSNIFEDAFR